MSLLLFIAGTCMHGLAQRVDFTYTSWGLEVHRDNVIQNAAHLEPFFEKLYQLQVLKDRKVSVLHVGDSHLQADYMTSIVRRSFHRHFGNAGRGLIVPLRVARTNEPGNFKTASSFRWQSKRCVFPDQPLPVGIGGVTIMTSQAGADLEIFMNDLWLDYSFNALTLFYERDERSFDFSVSDISGRDLASIVYRPEDSTRNYTRVQWDEPVGGVVLRARKSGAVQSRVIVYGMMLEGQSTGVLYHTVGVNGAKYRHYNAADRFAPQTAVLGSDLIILSLGTNESVDYPNIDHGLRAHIETLVSSLRANNPEAVFLLVTPQEVLGKGARPNPGIAEVRQEIIRYAVENGLAFYDMYRATGGPSSAGLWRDHALLSRDGIHLTREGYEYQGNLFYHALMKGYNAYVPARHP